MSQQDLQIRLKVEEMILYAYAPLRNFPKAEKHVLSAEIRQCMFRLLRLVVVVNRRCHKKTTMQDYRCDHVLRFAALDTETLFT